MDNNSGTQAQPASVNQPSQSVQPPPTPGVSQPPVQAGQVTQTFSQQPPISQQPEVTQGGSEDKPKSGKKRILIVLVVFVVLLALVVVGLFVVLTPTAKGLSACMEENSKNMDVLFQRGLEEKWTNQQKCLEFKPETEKLIACYEDVGSSSILPEQLAFTLGELIRGKEIEVNKEGLIKLHNTNCSQYPETLIGKREDPVTYSNPSSSKGDNIAENDQKLLIPSYIPSNLQEYNTNSETNEKGETVFLITYKSEGWSFLYYVQRNNPAEKECIMPNERERSVLSGYRNFIPDAATEGCVHMFTTTSDGSKSLYYRWFIDGVRYELTTLNYDLTDNEALKIANSLQSRK